MGEFSLWAGLGGLPPQEALDYLAARGRTTPTYHWQDLWQEEHAHQFTVSRLARADLLQAIQAGITASVNGDLSRRDFMRDIKALLAKEGWWGEKEVIDPATGEIVKTTFNPSRLKLIYDTNTRMAYAAGQWARIQRNKATHPYLRYITKRDERVRHTHRAWDNLVLPVDHPFWKTHFPPNGWRCRCRVAAVSQAEYERLLKEGTPSGPIRTEAPVIEAVPWKNPVTGEVLHVPAGIDPGFAYNPGMAMAEQLRRVAADKLAALAAPIRQAAASDLGLFVPPTAAEIRDFATRAFGAGNVQEMLDLGPVENAAKIGAATGLDVEGYSRGMDNFGVRHAYKQHGNAKREASRGQRAVTAADFALIRQIVADPDSIEHAGQSRHSRAELVRYTKRIGGELYVLVEEVRRKRRLLVMETLWIGNGN